MICSVTVKSRVAEDFQPVRMPLSCQPFGGSFADALGPVTAQESPVVQEEPQQIQVPMADLATQEEVAAQSAVEILDDGTGARGLGHRLQNRLVDRMPSLFQEALPSGGPLPVEIGSLVQGLDLTEGLYGRPGHGKPLGHLPEFLLQDLDKRQQGRSMVCQRPKERPDAMRAVVLISPQFRYEEVIQCLSFGQRGPGHRQNVLFHPLGQYPYIRRLLSCVKIPVFRLAALAIE